MLFSVLPSFASSSGNSMTGIVDVLNLLSNSEENVFVTRGEFLSLVMKTLKIDYNGYSDEPIFADITTSHKYYSQIVFAAKAGIVTGTTDGRFYPDDYITFEQASVIMVRAMNYEKLVENNNHYTLANKLGLFDGVTQSSTYVLKHDVERILLNILVANYPKYSYVYGGVILEDTDETFLNHIWGLYIESGIVDSTDFCSVTGKPQRPDEVTINGVLYDSSIASLDELFGMKARVFYAEENDKKVIYYAYPLDENVVNRYDGKVFSSFGNSQISFYNDSGKKEIYNINSKTSLIWNNKNMKTADFIVKLDDNPNEFVLIDNNGDGIVDVVYALKYKVYGKGYADVYNGIIIDDENPNLEIEKYSSYLIKNADGEDLDISDLKSEWHYLVYDPEDYNYPLMITAIDIFIEGKIKEIDFQNGYVTLETGDEYSISSSGKIGVNDLKTGFQYFFYFDKDWSIINAEETKRDSVQAVYFIMASKDRLGNVEARILLEDNDMKIVSFDSKVSFRDANGVESTKPITASVAFDKMKYNGAFKPQLGFVKFNNSGKISKIIIPCTDVTKPYHIQEYTKMTGSSDAGRRWFSSQHSFENQIQLKPSTKVFVVPDHRLQTQDDEYYKVVTTSSFANDRVYKINEYDGPLEDRYTSIPVVANVGQFAADYFVLECPSETSFGVSGGTFYGLITRISDYYEEKLGTAKEVTILNAKTMLEESYVIRTDNDVMYDRDGNKIDVGDIVKLTKTSSYMRSKDIVIFYDRGEENEFKFITSYDYGVGASNEIGYRFYADMRVTQGKVESIVNNIAKCVNMTSNKNSQTIEYVDFSKCKIIKFNSSKKGYEEYPSNYLKKGDNYIATMTSGRFTYVIFY